MKYLLTSLSLLALTANYAFADLEKTLKRNWKESTGTSKIYAGFNNSTLDIGLSHERRKGSIGVDTTLFLSTENDSATSSSDTQFLLAPSLIYHLNDGSNADVYAGTGLAVAYNDDVGTSSDSETTFGPLFKVGSSYYFNEDWSLGLEYMVYLNWTDDSLSSQFNYGLLNLGYTY